MGLALISAYPKRGVTAFCVKNTGSDSFDKFTDSFFICSLCYILSPKLDTSARIITFLQLDIQFHRTMIAAENIGKYLRILDLFHQPFRYDEIVDTPSCVVLSCIETV